MFLDSDWVDDGISFGGVDEFIFVCLNDELVASDEGILDFGLDDLLLANWFEGLLVECDMIVDLFVEILHNFFCDFWFAFYEFWGEWDWYHFLLEDFDELWFFLDFNYFLFVDLGAAYFNDFFFFCVDVFDFGFMGHGDGYYFVD